VERLSIPESKTEGTDAPRGTTTLGPSLGIQRTLNPRWDVTLRATFTELSAPELLPLRPLGTPVEELEDIRAELIALFHKQLQALDRDTFVGLTEAERHEYDARHARLQELHAKLGRFKIAA
jgi:hypothetical protein